MAKNKLFEAAAEILAAGKGKNAMPAEKLEGGAQDAGGPTPENAKPDDDSHKMTFTSKSSTAPTTKASAASAKMEEEQKDGENGNECRMALNNQGGVYGSKDTTTESCSRKCIHSYSGAITSGNESCKSSTGGMVHAI